MPAPIAFTAKQLGDIAARVNGFTEHRRTCAKMGVPTTPNSFRCRFPSGHRGTLVWEEAQMSKKLLERNDGKTVWRYVVYLDATIDTDEHPKPDNGMVISLPHGKDPAALEGAVNTAVLRALAKGRAVTDTEAEQAISEALTQVSDTDGDDDDQKPPTYSPEAIKRWEDTQRWRRDAAYRRY